MSNKEISKDNANRRKELKEEIDSSMRNIMTTEQGRKLVYHLSDYTSVFASPFNPDAITMAKNAGIQIAALRTRQFIIDSVGLDLYQLMQVENSQPEKDTQNK